METVINPMVIKWIDQLDDWDPSSAYYAYQCLEREALHSSKPGNGAACEALAKSLADALIGKEEAKTAEGDEDGTSLPGCWATFPPAKSCRNLPRRSKTMMSGKWCGTRWTPTAPTARRRY